jgi:hypothetical protein
MTDEFILRKNRIKIFALVLIAVFILSNYANAASGTCRGGIDGKCKRVNTQTSYCRSGAWVLIPSKQTYCSYCGSVDAAYCQMTAPTTRVSAAATTTQRPYDSTIPVTTTSYLPNPTTTTSYPPTTLAPVFLIVDVISPRSGASASNVREIRLRIRYSNDGLIPDQSLNALVGDKTVPLVRAGDFFAGNYSPPGGVSDLNISVSDSLGYSGKADVLLVLSPSSVDDSAVQAAGSFGVMAAGLFVLFALSLMIFRRFRGSNADKSIERGRFNNVKKATDSLNKGGDELISKWVFDKLSHGEDPAVLKKGMEEMGYDPKIVDRVLGKPA